MNGNQLVAFNVRRLRHLHRWTLAELAALLGDPWTGTSLGDAERSAVNDRVRRFDADEILLFARIFKVNPLSLLIEGWHDGDGEVPYEPLFRLETERRIKAEIEKRIRDASLVELFALGTELRDGAS